MYQIIIIYNKREINVDEKITIIIILRHLWNFVESIISTFTWKIYLSLQGKLEAWQEEEARALAEELEKESKELAAYQV